MEVSAEDCSIQAGTLSAMTVFGNGAKDGCGGGSGLFLDQAFEFIGSTFRLIIIGSNDHHPECIHLVIFQNNITFFTNKKLLGVFIKGCNPGNDIRVLGLPYLTGVEKPPDAFACWKLL